MIALVVTIIVLLILAGVSLNTAFGSSGIIKKAQITKNELEISYIRDALQIYYLGNWMTDSQANPVKDEQFDSTKITDEETKNKIVEYQLDIESVDQIHYERLYELDMKKLGLSETENEYIMDVETRIIFINNGLEVNKGKIYVIEEKEILPATIETTQGTNGFVLIANADENIANVIGYNFYINNELYKTVTTSQKTTQIEVTEKDFGEYECYVKISVDTGEIYTSSTITAENYYIKNKADIETFRNTVNEGTSYYGKTVKVVSNINLEGSTTNRNWTPIGTETSTFQGTFDGGNFEIQNLYNTETTAEYQGLFGSIANATIKNVKIASGEIQGSMYCGAIAGYGENNKIQNCSNSINIIAEKGLVGGIIGRGKGYISNCTNRGNIEGKGDSNNNKGTWAGGIVGRNLYSDVTKSIVDNCHNYGEVFGYYADVGGIVGGTENSILNSTNKGNVSANTANADGASTLGGIVGVINNVYNLDDMKIENCNNTGNIFGDGMLVAGIAGIAKSVDIINCYNTGNISSETAYIGGITAQNSLASNSEKYGTIQECYNIGKVEAKGYVSDHKVASTVGGITARNYGYIIKCWNSGNIVAFNAYVGGITGGNEKEIEQCYNIGTLESENANINGNNVIGGIAGENKETAIVSECYNKGEIIANYRFIGGIAGFDRTGAKITNCYNTYNIENDATNYRHQISGNYVANSANVTNCYYLGTTTTGLERTAADMKTTAFINLIGGTTYWKLDSSNINNGFVILSWQ